MSDKFTEEFERIEVHWFHRHLEVEREKKLKRMIILSEPAGKVLSNSEKAEFDKLQAVIEDFDRAIQIIGEQKASVSKTKFKLLSEKEILEEAVELNDNINAKNEAQQRIDEIQKRIDDADKVKLTLNRAVIRFAINLINDDLVKFRTKLIPAYENAKEEDFTDPIYTKTYYVNKARKSKKTLETFKKKLEKGL